MGAGANRPSAQGRCGANHPNAQGRCGANHPSCKLEILGNSGCKNGQARVYCPSSLPKFSAQLAAAQPVVWPAAGSVSLTDSTRCPTSSSKIPHVQANILQNFSQVSNTFLLVRIAPAGRPGSKVLSKAGYAANNPSNSGTIGNSFRCVRCSAVWPHPIPKDFDV